MGSSDSKERESCHTPSFDEEGEREEEASGNTWTRWMCLWMQRTQSASANILRDVLYSKDAWQFNLLKSEKMRFLTVRRHNQEYLQANAQLNDGDIANGRTSFDLWQLLIFVFSIFNYELQKRLISDMVSVWWADDQEGINYELPFINSSSTSSAVTIHNLRLSRSRQIMSSRIAWATGYFNDWAT